MAVSTVVAGVEFAAEEPFPEGRVGSVEGLAPGLGPIEEVGIVVEAFRKMFFAELFDVFGIGKIVLGDKFFVGIVIVFFLTMHGVLCFG